MVRTVETKRAGIILLFGMFQVVLGSTLPSGLYAIYERDWDLSRVQSTLVFASYVAGVLCSLIFLGSLADRIGRKPVILFFRRTCRIIQSHVLSSHRASAACCRSFIERIVCGGLHGRLHFCLK